jgi:hypothetical protein
MEHQKPKLIHKMSKTFRKAKWHLKTIVKNKPFLIALIAIPIAVALLGKHEIAKAPVITVTTPVEKSLVTDKQLYVRGKVWPADSDVTVNNTAVARNGNGEFTAMIDIPVGQSILKFSSTLNGKVSSLIMPIERKRSPEEEMAYEQQQARDQALSDQKVAGLKDEVVNKVNKLQDVQSMIKITSQQVATIGAQRKITGTLLNSGTNPAYGVTAIITLYDTSHAVVDIQQVKVVTGSSPMTAGQSLPFATLLSSKIFTTFDVTVTASAQPTTADEAGSGLTPTPIGGVNSVDPANPNYR